MKNPKTTPVKRPRGRPALVSEDLRRMASQARVLRALVRDLTAIQVELELLVDPFRRLMFEGDIEGLNRLAAEQAKGDAGSDP